MFCRPYLCLLHGQSSNRMEGPDKCSACLWLGCKGTLLSLPLLWRDGMRPILLLPECPSGTSLELGTSVLTVLSPISIPTLSESGIPGRKTALCYWHIANLLRKYRKGRKTFLDACWGSYLCFGALNVLGVSGCGTAVRTAAHSCGG